MSLIYYSIGGEGRGHVTRAIGMIEALHQNCRIVVYTSGHSYELIKSYFQEDDITIRQIPGLHFHYSPHKKLSYAKTFWFGINYLLKLRSLVRRMQKDIEDEAPQLAIVDFEPSLPRAALKCLIPFISLDHQHFLITYDLSSLPPQLKWHTTYMGWIVRSYYQGQQETIVSSFFFPPLRKGVKNVKQIGVILRPEIIQATRERRGHVVAYFRRFASRQMVEALNECGCEVRIYGLGELPPSGRLRFFATQIARFVDDLSTSKALITTAGNQLVGEALFLGKPVLVIPEYGNYEQAINGYFLQLSGAGWAIEPHRFNGEIVRSFMKNISRFKYKGKIERLYGNPAALAIIKKYLPKNEHPYSSNAYRMAAPLL